MDYAMDSAVVGISAYQQFENYRRQTNAAHDAIDASYESAERFAIFLRAEVDALIFNGRAVGVDKVAWDAENVSHSVFVPPDVEGIDHFVDIRPLLVRWTTNAKMTELRRQFYNDMDLSTLSLGEILSRLRAKIDRLHDLEINTRWEISVLVADIRENPVKKFELFHAVRALEDVYLDHATNTYLCEVEHAAMMSQWYRLYAAADAEGRRALSLWDEEQADVEGLDA